MCIRDSIRRELVRYLREVVSPVFTMLWGAILAVEEMILVVYIICEGGPVEVFAPDL